MKLIAVSKESNGDYLLKFRSDPSFLLAWLGYGPKFVEYVGSCTVWHSVPGFVRCGTMTESWLADVFEMVKYCERHGVNPCES